MSSTIYRSTKTFGHECGFSVAFRQWRAESHCRLLHGYALAFKFTFEAEELDVRNWVVDFGALKSLKGILEALQKVTRALALTIKGFDLEQGAHNVR